MKTIIIVSQFLGIVLKLIGVLNIEWALVFTPVYILATYYILLFLVLGIIVYFIFLIGALKEGKTIKEYANNLQEGFKEFKEFKKLND